MRIENLLSILTICLFISCDPGCTGDQQEAARRTVSDAFLEWRQALDYMDASIIDKAYGDLLDCAAEARLCIVVDTAALLQLEAVNTVFSNHRPSPESILEAERLISEMEPRFTGQDQHDQNGDLEN